MIHFYCIQWIILQIISTNQGIPLVSVEITTIKQLPIGRSRMESVEK